MAGKDVLPEKDSALMAPETSFIRGGLKAFVPGGVLPNGKAFSFV